MIESLEEPQKRNIWSYKVKKKTEIIMKCFQVKSFKSQIIFADFNS